jgi:hypothetical protein
METRIGRSTYAVIQQDAGDQQGVWLNKATLASQCEALQVKTGDRVGFKYLGPRTSREGRQYDAYRVVKDPTAQERPFVDLEGDSDSQVIRVEDRLG